MKAFIITLLVILMAFSLGACGMRKNTDTTTKPTEDTSYTDHTFTDPTIIDPTIIDPTIMDPTLDTNIPDPSINETMPDMMPTTDPMK